MSISKPDDLAAEDLKTNKREKKYDDDYYYDASDNLGIDSNYKV